MALDFSGIKDTVGRWLGRSTTSTGVECVALATAAIDLQLRVLAFETCTNMIANAVGRCEFKTFEKNKLVQGIEYYLWNVEPNKNQNATDFLHKLVYQLCLRNEALIALSGKQMFVADDYGIDDADATKMNRYTNVTVGTTTLAKTFTEKDVIRIRLHHANIKPVLDGMYESYGKLITVAQKHYVWKNGKHYKMHVSSMAQGEKDWEKKFTKRLNDQVKTFFEADNAVLPEFDGNEYTDMTNDRTTSQNTTRDIRALVDDIFEFTARAFGIPPVLVLGGVADSKDATSRWLTTCIDPICDQLQEEITRKKYGQADFQAGSYIKIDTSTIEHLDLFSNAANIEKLIGSGFTYNDMQRAIGGVEVNEDWANYHFITKNFATAEELMKGGEKE